MEWILYISILLNVVNDAVTTQKKANGYVFAR